MQVSIYHKLLRVSAIVVTLVLLFDSGLFSPVTRELSDNTIHYLASSVTGMSASVEENELNRVSAELNQWEGELAAREAALNDRRIPARNFGTDDLSSNTSTYILSTILFILTVLIVLNYALDYARMRKRLYENGATV